MVKQVTSKEVNRPCSVREELNSNLAIAGVLWGLVNVWNFSLNLLGSGECHHLQKIFAQKSERSFQVAPLVLGPVSALVGSLCCKLIANNLNIPPQPFKPGEDDAQINDVSKESKGR